ncbi:glutathione ABC transporter substrate-binding protein [Truepera radiovictrix]|uniref:Extracellular solute-binding protein family 5 n=1 Tax=Truepera radiovictrix (strain DSM 17093 / CIP 108686 / LMG 22925 / RQ-24) TaxID=649638 RepID=D7CUX0_TRURR|nr:glutathione ABC transporter substrate-binding protein [Truepera radiovictrix]ADI15797.1 extracellular solute-binding protein family 5 [Truepera radiovictrix DSM 17093]WMT58575.1 glutathione ABC transporter substrate-binding protein [Truepera radiovictrix]
MKRIVSGLTVLGLFWAGALAQAQTITVGQGADAVTLDPHGTNDQPSARVMRQIYDTLIIQQEDLELVPGLAESWEQLDDTTWEFTLREGVTFHNGEPLTADDVVFTFNRLTDPEVAAPAAFLLGFVESVEAADERTVRITTQYPFAPILAHLSHTATSILNEQAVTEAGEDYGTTTVVGTGPFSFVRWEPATQIVLERNDDWWGGEVLPERVVFRPIIEGTVRAIELETGGIDIAYGLEPTDANRIEGGGVPGVRLETVETLSTNYIGFNVQKEPFDDVRVRQAINHAVDVDLIIEAVLEGRAIPATGPIAPAVFGARTDLEPYAYDPERARELLAEAGLEGGFSTTIWTNDNPTRIQIAEIVQAMLLDVGINVDVQVLEWGTYLADTAEGLHDMFILGWVSVTGDADYGLYSLFHSEQMGNPGNRTFFANERVDELLDLGRSSADEEERLAAYAEAQEIILEEAPWLFLNITVEDNGVRDNVEGFVPHPAGHHRLHSVTITGS